jgi:hypothetical protein
MFAVIKPSTTVEVADYRNLIGQWRNMPKSARRLVGVWVVEKITSTQKKRLPADLRQKLVVGHDAKKTRDDVQFLERLYRLEDPRG